MSITKLDKKQLSNFLRYNPAFIKKMEKHLSNTVAISDILNVNLSTVEYKGEIQNLYIVKPILYFNLMLNNEYLNALPKIQAELSSVNPVETLPVEMIHKKKKHTKMNLKNMVIIVMVNI